MYKRGAELSINVMILIALGLAVLIVLVYSFTSQAGIFNKTVLTCESKGGQCVEKGKCQYEQSSFNCPKKEEVCCINV